MTQQAPLNLDRVGEHVAVELWHVDCESLSAILEAEEYARPRLSADEILRGSRIGTETDRRIWRASHIALRLLIERWGGEQLRRQPFSYAADGKPSLARPAPAFSLSHSGRLALVALAREGAIGADLQQVAGRLIKDVRRQRMEEYAVRIANGSPLPEERDRRFVQAWTRIEALAKADGRGIGRTLTEAGLVGGRNSMPNAAQFVVRDVSVNAAFSSAVAAPAWPATLVNSRDLAELLARVTATDALARG